MGIASEHEIGDKFLMFFYYNIPTVAAIVNAFASITKVKKVGAAPVTNTG